MPPKWMWTLDDELQRHFERVRERRKAELGVEDDDDEEARPAMTVHNEYARGRGRS